MKLFHLALVCAVGCSSIDARMVVTSNGDIPVGHRRVTLTTVQAGTGDLRELPVEVWYPAVDGGEEDAEYGIAGLVEFEDAGVLANAATLPGEHPVMVYSHGSGGVGALAYPFARRFASHGWVVVAPDHVGNTSLDILGGGGFAQSSVDRPRDIRALLDGLEDGTFDDEVSLVSDVQRTVVMGHSFGGYTTLRSPGIGIDPTGFDCENNPRAECDALTPTDVQEALRSPEPDPRIRAILPQAPAFLSFFDPGDLATLPPMLLMSGENDQTTPDATQAAVAWEHTAGADDVWVHVPDGGHYSFITVCDDVPATLLGFFGAEGDGCGDGFTPVSDVVPTLAAYSLAFAEWHGNENRVFEAVFEGTTLAPHVTLEVR